MLEPASMTIFTSTFPKQFPVERAPMNSTTSSLEDTENDRKLTLNLSRNSDCPSDRGVNRINFSVASLLADTRNRKSPSPDDRKTPSPEPARFMLGHQQPVTPVRPTPTFIALAAAAAAYGLQHSSSWPSVHGPYNPASSVFPSFTNTLSNSPGEFMLL